MNHRPHGFSHLTPPDARVLLGFGLRALPDLLRPDQLEPPASFPAPDWDGLARRLAAGEDPGRRALFTVRWWLKRRPAVGLVEALLVLVEDLCREALNLRLDGLPGPRSRAGWELMDVDQLAWLAQDRAVTETTRRAAAALLVARGEWAP